MALGILSISAPELLIILMTLALLLVVVVVVVVAVRSSRPKAAPLPPTGYPPVTRVDEIERLAKLHADGALSDEEFHHEKRRVLGS